MKKITTILLLISSTFLFGQESAFKQYVKLGVNGTQVSGDGLKGFNKGGLTGGFGVIREVKNNLSYNISITYSQKGSRMPLDSLTRQIYLMRLHYVEVPVYIQWKFKPKFKFNLGAAYGRLISSVEKDANGNLPTSNPFRKSDYSYLFGLDYMVTNKLGVIFNYLGSVRVIRRHAGGGIPTYSRFWELNKGQYNSVLSLNIMYTLK